jgi:hypothetical protein
MLHWPKIYLGNGCSSCCLAGNVLASRPVPEVVHFEEGHLKKVELVGEISHGGATAVSKKTAICSPGFQHRFDNSAGAGIPADFKLDRPKIFSADFVDKFWREILKVLFWVSDPLCLSSSLALHFVPIILFRVHLLVNRDDRHLLAHAMASDFSF